MKKVISIVVALFMLTSVICMPLSSDVYAEDERDKYGIFIEIEGLDDENKGLIQFIEKFMPLFEIIPLSTPADSLDDPLNPPVGETTYLSTIVQMILDSLGSVEDINELLSSAGYPVTLTKFVFNPEIHGGVSESQFGNSGEFIDVHESLSISLQVKVEGKIEDKPFSADVTLKIISGGYGSLDFEEYVIPGSDPEEKVWTLSKASVDVALGATIEGNITYKGIPITLSDLELNLLFYMDILKKGDKLWQTVSLINNITDFINKIPYDIPKSSPTSDHLTAVEELDYGYFNIPYAEDKIVLDMITSLTNDDIAGYLGSTIADIVNSIQESAITDEDAISAVKEILPSIIGDDALKLPKDQADAIDSHAIDIYGNLVNAMENKTYTVTFNDPNGEQFSLSTGYGGLIDLKDPLILNLINDTTSGRFMYFTANPDGDKDVWVIGPIYSDITLTPVYGVEIDDISKVTDGGAFVLSFDPSKFTPGVFETNSNATLAVIVNMEETDTMNFAYSICWTSPVGTKINDPRVNIVEVPSDIRELCPDLNYDDAVMLNFQQSGFCSVIISINTIDIKSGTTFDVWHVVEEEDDDGNIVKRLECVQQGVVVNNNHMDLELSDFSDYVLIKSHVPSDAKSDNTILFVGVGAGIVVLAAAAFFLFRMKH